MLHDYLSQQVTHALIHVHIHRLGPDFGFDADACVLRKDNFLHILAKVALSALILRCWWVNGRQQTAHRVVHLMLAASVFMLPNLLAATGTAVGPRFLREGRKEHDDEGEGEAELEAGRRTGVRAAAVAWVVMTTRIGLVVAWMCRDV